ncbi:MAG: T9SS type A sorting domain-containing protein [Bacteroidota bacterium]|nr:T9SS type A sorting domain-containing protein [Bacteroidota bacterium]
MKSHSCKYILLLLLLSIFSGNVFSQKKFLFDATKAETAGNADWVIDEDSTPQRFPTPAESTVTSSTLETYWTGALSAWGLALVKMGHHVETLPSGTAITYGNASNIQDLKNYDVYIVDEPNTPFSDAEKTALLQFVKNGGGLFMISDHGAADRNNDGWDAVRIWNDLMRNNSVQSLPFGMMLDSNSITETTANILSAPVNEILNGTAGQVTQFKFSAGSTITIDTVSNPTVRALVWRSGVPQGTTKVMVASAFFGKGKVVLVGDSSPADDGTGASGNTLYNGWTGDVGVSHANLHLNASVWLAKKDSTVTVVHSNTTKNLSFTLAQNYPNPFNPTTTISYQLSANGFTTLKVYDILGNEVATLVNEVEEAGNYSVTFSAEGGSASGRDASKFSSGIYFARLQSGENIQFRKMMLIK